MVIFETTFGEIAIELYPEEAPVTTENFIDYVNSGFYDETIFHRVIPRFVIQGGGFESGLAKKETNPPIKNEASNGLKNTRGALSMARTNVVDSATSQFFINLTNNDFLDQRDTSDAGYGYAVFARVVEGLDVIDRIAAQKTATVDGFQDVPTKDILIKKAYLK